MITNKIYNKVLVGVFSHLLPLTSCFFISIAFVSCSDFFEQESDQIIYADKEHLNSATDSIYSVTGILNKLQVLADRTVLLGEVRGDLTSITSVASSDLRDVAQIGRAHV